MTVLADTTNSRQVIALVNGRGYPPGLKALRTLCQPLSEVFLHLLLSSESAVRLNGRTRTVHVNDFGVDEVHWNWRNRSK